MVMKFPLFALTQHDLLMEGHTDTNGGLAMRECNIFVSFYLNMDEHHPLDLIEHNKVSLR